LLSGATTPQLADEHNIDRTNRAVDYIFAHYARDLPLEEVAEHLGMKPTYFSRVFKQATGRCFIEFVNRLRISKSCELLADGDKPVTDVCFESGFNNISNFNRRFQQLKGMTPSHYRRLAVQRLTEQNHGLNAPNSLWERACSRTAFVSVNIYCGSNVKPPSRAGPLPQVTTACKPVNLYGIDIAP
jgi:AraC-like DNA-binding protein